MNTIKLETVVQRSNNLLTAAISGGTVMMDVMNGVYFGLDEIGMEVWNRLEQPKAVARLVKELQELYDGDEEVITRDVLELLENLSANRLLLIVS